MQTLSCQIGMGVVLKEKEKADLFVHFNCESQTFPRQLRKGGFEKSAIFLSASVYIF